MSRVGLPNAIYRVYTTASLYKDFVADSEEEARERMSVTKLKELTLVCEDDDVGYRAQGEVEIVEKL